MTELRKIQAQLEAILESNNPLKSNTDQLAAATKLLVELKAENLQNIGGLTIEQILALQESSIPYWNNAISPISRTQ
ncbi:MAG: hypothetical protein H0U72_00645 [Nitrosospira sp.]|nr:hypothetical protein [Nitrosospira sp.]